MELNEKYKFHLNDFNRKVLVNLFISCWLVLRSALEVTKSYDISMLMG